MAVSDGSGVGFQASTAGTQLVLRRFVRERLGVAALVCLVLVVGACFVGEPILARVLGHGPDTFFPRAVDVNLNAVGPWAHVPDQPLDAPPRHGTTLFVLGADGPLGRDELLRLLAGGRLSLALDAGTALTAAIYVETVFGLSGLGHLAVIGLSGAFFPQGAPHYDLPLIVGLVLTVGVFVVGLNVLADIAGAWLDPRRREQASTR